MKMRKFKNNKLCRDNIPEKMRAIGSIIHVKLLNHEEFETELRNKLVEEAQEAHGAQSRKELISELADLYEVVDTLQELHGITHEDVLAQQCKKREDAGGFARKQYVTITEHPEGSMAHKYCLAQPEKYPEVIE